MCNVILLNLHFDQEIIRRNVTVSLSVKKKCDKLYLNKTSEMLRILFVLKNVP